jgi:hypothetical protein
MSVGEGTAGEAGGAEAPAVGLVNCTAVGCTDVDCADVDCAETVADRVGLTVCAAAVPSLGAEACVVQAANVAGRKITPVTVHNLTHQYDILIHPVMPRCAHERGRGRSPTLQL